MNNFFKNCFITFIALYRPNIIFYLLSIFFPLSLTTRNNPVVTDERNFYGSTLESNHNIHFPTVFTSRPNTLITIFNKINVYPKYTFYNFYKDFNYKNIYTINYNLKLVNCLKIFLLIINI